MGLLSRRKDQPPSAVEVATDTDAPERQAREKVWTREVERLGRAEVLRRLAALSARGQRTDGRTGGRTGPSGFETWNRQIESEIQELAKKLAAQTPQ